MIWAEGSKIIIKSLENPGCMTSRAEGLLQLEQKQRNIV